MPRASNRNYAHVVDVSLADYLLRILQIVPAFALLALGALLNSFVGRSPAASLPLAAAIWDILILAYYLIAVHALPFIYNWAVLIITETLSVALWAAAFSTLAAAYAQNKFSARLNGNLAISIVALSAFTLSRLHVITFLLFGNGVRKHRHLGRPLFSPQGRKAKAMSETETQQV